MEDMGVSLKNIFDGIFKGKNVLVTGHTGFKGSWLTLWLKELGAEITGYALEPPTEPNMFDACGIDKEINSVRGDVRDLDHLKEVFEDIKPEIVFHLAAQSLVRESYKEPVQTYETNVIGTVNVLESSRKTSSVRVIVIVTSDKCYENKEWDRGYREDDPMGGFDPYSSSKGCAELVTSAYRRSFFNPSSYGEHGVSLSSVRAGNVIGGGDWGVDRLIPDCIRSLEKGETIGIRSQKSIRPWQYVLDPLNGYLLLAERMWQKGAEFSSAWNFGPSEGDIFSVGEVATRVVDLWGEGRWENISSSSSAEPHEAKNLRLDASKARKILDWKPGVSFNEALKMTVKWYQQYYRKPDDILNYSLKQLKQYSEQLV